MRIVNRLYFVRTWKLRALATNFQLQIEAKQVRLRYKKRRELVSFWLVYLKLLPVAVDWKNVQLNSEWLAILVGVDNSLYFHSPLITRSGL